MLSGIWVSSRLNSMTMMRSASPLFLCFSPRRTFLIEKPLLTLKENNFEPKIGRSLAASLKHKGCLPGEKHYQNGARPGACWVFAFSSLQNKTQDRTRHLIPTFLILYIPLSFVGFICLILSCVSLK